MSYVIAFYHQKGGVGKTTSALSLGAAFVEQRVETLIVDLDPQANLTSNIGVDPEKAPCSIREVLTGEIGPGQAAMESSLPGLDLIPANASLSDLNRRLYRMPEYEFLLSRALQDRALAEYALVLLDCPPSVSPLTINALTAAELLIIPTQCEYYSIQALAALLELVNVIRDKTNPLLTYRLLVTMFDGRGNFHARMLEHLREFFPEGLLRTAIGFDTKLREAQAVGRPITLHAPRSRSAGQYRQLAKELSIHVSANPHLQTA